MAGEPNFEPFQTTNLTPYIDALNKHAKHLADLQERDMTSPTQRRHDELRDLLTEIRDALTGDKQPGPEPVDVTEEPPVGSQVTEMDDDALGPWVWGRHTEGWRVWTIDRRWGVATDWTIVCGYGPLRLTTDADRERVGLPVDTAPDVDPDEKCDLCGGGPNSPSHVVGCPPGYLDARRWKARAEKAEAEVERLTRERDEAVKEIRRLHYNPVAQEMKRQRDKAVKRHEALRAAIQTDPSVLRLAASDIEAQGTGWWKLPRSLPATLRGIADALTRDDERAKRERGRDE